MLFGFKETPNTRVYDMQFGPQREEPVEFRPRCRTREGKLLRSSFVEIELRRFVFEPRGVGCTKSAQFPFNSRLARSLGGPARLTSGGSPASRTCAILLHSLHGSLLLLRLCYATSKGKLSLLFNLAFQIYELERTGKG